MNIQELNEINMRYLQEHYEITERDKSNINKIIKIIENTRDNTQPKTGDIVVFTSQHGEYYKNAIISNSFDGDDFEICKCPYTPFFSSYEDLTKNIKISVSGGAFHTFNKNMFKYKGKKQRLFCDWGICGPCADGAIDFYATVNIWEVKEKNIFGDYTTEKYQKMTIRKLEEPSDFGYIIIGDGVAFKNEQDYKAFLKTYRAKEFQINYNTTVFLYKKECYLITKEEFNKLINYKIDTRRINGSIVTVKVKYDNKHKKIIEYRYSNRFEENQEISNKPYILARKELKI